MNKKLLYQSFFLLFFIAVLNWLSIKLFLYLSFRWTDSILHFLAGFSVALFAVWFLSIWQENSSKKVIIIFSFICVLIIGVVWELFELYFNITFLSDGIHYITDTSSDLLMDILGGFLASLYAFRLLNKKQYEEKLQVTS